MKRRIGSLLAACSALGAAVALWACPPPPPLYGTIGFNVPGIPPNITRVVARVETGDTVVLTPVNADNAGYTARGSLDVEAGYYVVQVNAYEATELWYGGEDTVRVIAGESVDATVLIVCVHPGCSHGTISVFSAFPRPESEPNNSTASCDTTSWSRNFELITGSGVPAPYTYGGHGTISSETDVDYWCAFIDFSTVDSLVAFTITDAGSGVDPVLTLYGPAGNVLTSNDNAGGENPNDARVEWDITAQGRYYLAVSAASAPTAPGRYSVFMHVGWPQTIP